jgi:metallophosphoesterase superfamily enzyme
MSRPDQDVHVETERMLAEAGIVVTDEGRARARAKLRAAAERMTPEAWARLDERYGRPSAA